MDFTKAEELALIRQLAERLTDARRRALLRQAHQWQPKSGEAKQLPAWPSPNAVTNERPLPDYVLGIDGKQHPARSHDTTTRDAEIRAMRGAGKSIRAIAIDACCSVGTVHRVLKLHPIGLLLYRDRVGSTVPVNPPCDPDGLPTEFYEHEGQTWRRDVHSSSAGAYIYEPFS